MKMILTEKPSVSSDFAAALDCIKCDGYFQNEKYAIVNARGHLFEPFYPEDYDEKYKKWNISDLPINPPVFKYKHVRGAGKEYKNILKCIKENQINEFIVATDAGREGENIARNIINKIRGELPEDIVFKRFWTAEGLTKEVVLKNIKAAKPLEEYNGLYEKSRIRCELDWLIGMNMSRLLSCKSGATLSFGRVQTPVCYKVFDTEMKRKGHVKEKYYTTSITAEKDKTTLTFTYITDEKVTDKNKAIALYNDIKNEKILNVDDVNSEKLRKKPPLLMNLNDLQSVANKKYGYTAKETLQIAQRLYENKKYLSYPRTPSRVMGDDDYEYLSKILKLHNITTTENFTINNKKIFNSEKLEDHHALLILKPTDCSDLSESETNIYNLVLQRMKMVVEKDYVYRKTTVIGNVKNHLFKSVYNTTLQKGWKKYATEKEEDVECELLVQIKDIFNIIDIKNEEKETQPPKKETDSSLLSFMEKNNLGQPATRTGIIETLFMRKYIVRDKKAITITPLGESFIKTLLKNKDIFENYITPKYTQFFEEEIEKINWSIKEKTIDILNSTIERYSTDKIEIVKNSNENHTCPLCGKKIYVSDKNYYCSGYKEGCKLNIQKIILCKKLTDKNIKDLLSGKKTNELTFTSRNNKHFKAKLELDKGSVKFVFTNK